MWNTNVSLDSHFLHSPLFLSFFCFLLFHFTFLSFYFSFFYLRKYISPLIPLRLMKQIFSVSFFPFLNIYIYIYNFQYLWRVEAKTVLSCSYLFEGFTSQVPFFYGRVTSPSESAGYSPKILFYAFYGHSPEGAVDRRLYLSTSVLKH